MTKPLPTIGILGGTGPQGSGLALRWARAGYPVILGGRDGAKSWRIASELNGRLNRPAVRPETHAATARQSEIVVLAVPFGAQQGIVQGLGDTLNGKILVDVTVPLVPPKVSVVQLPAAGSAAVQLQALLGPAVRVVSAFQNISAQHLHDLEHEIDCDVLVCGDDGEACDIVVTLAQAAGMRAWRAGVLANAAAAEALTSILIAINRRYKIAGSGIRITGTPTQPRA